MPPDIIQTQQEVVRKHVDAMIALALIDRKSELWEQAWQELDTLITEAIANIGRELEARCEEELYDDPRVKSHKLHPTQDWSDCEACRENFIHNQAIDRTLTLIRSITGISPTR